MKTITSLTPFGFPDHFTADILESVFMIVSVILFIAILLTINQLRQKFSATTCLELGGLVILFTIAADSQIRSIIFQNLLEPFIDSLLGPLKKLLGLLLSRSF